MLICEPLTFGLRGVETKSGLVKGVEPKHLFVVKDSALRHGADHVFVSTLQGLLARHSPNQIYVQTGANDVWMEDLISTYGITTENIPDVQTLIQRTPFVAKGYIRFDLSRTNSINAAVSLCAAFDAVAVDRSIEAEVRQTGLTNRLMDVSERDENWVWETYRSRFNSQIVVEQKEQLTLALRDYAVLAGAFTFFEGNSSFRDRVMKALMPPAYCLGWGDATRGEETFIGPTSRDSVVYLPADHARNLSTLSGIREARLSQKPGNSEPVPHGAHTVCFVLTDGDNLQFNLNAMARYFQQKQRGRFAMGWALSPALADLAPSVMRWYYDNGVAGKDSFVTGPSGPGYIYPSLWPKDRLKPALSRLNDQMRQGDLHIVQILDFKSLPQTELWKAYTANSSVDALFYLEYSRHDQHAGRIVWVNGKPVITPRHLLWKGLNGCDEDSLIRRLNAGTRDDSTMDGYSLVVVHAWSKTLANIEKVVGALDPGVRVVTPEEFVRLIRDRVPPAKSK